MLLTFIPCKMVRDNQERFVLIRIDPDKIDNVCLINSHRNRCKKFKWGRGRPPYLAVARCGCCR
jgi:hypothetical protein